MSKPFSFGYYPQRIRDAIRAIMAATHRGGSRGVIDNQGGIDWVAFELALLSELPIETALAELKDPEIIRLARGPAADQLDALYINSAKRYLEVVSLAERYLETAPRIVRRAVYSFLPRWDRANYRCEIRPFREQWVHILELATVSERALRSADVIAPVWHQFLLEAERSGPGAARDHYIACALVCPADPPEARKAIADHSRGGMGKCPYCALDREARSSGAAAVKEAAAARETRAYDDAVNIAELLAKN
jgi:hypothetical protein